MKLYVNEDVEVNNDILLSALLKESMGDKVHEFMVEELIKVVKKLRPSLFKEVSKRLARLPSELQDEGGAGHETKGREGKHLDSNQQLELPLDE